MFTGIVSAVGTVERIEGSDALRRAVIASPYAAEGIALGASIACAGICLTVVAVEPRPGGAAFTVEIAAETLRLTLAREWQAGTRLNLERALAMGEELGGHLVTGHVDGLATIFAREEVTPDAANWGATARFVLEAPAPLHRFVAAKGSVTLDGVSLTVNRVEGQRFEVLLIPHTLAVTTFGVRREGERVHLEVDLMARYAARLAETA